MAVLCHFQYCVSHLPHLCCRQGKGGGVQETHVLCHFQYYFSHLPHMCCRHYKTGGFRKLIHTPPENKEALLLAVLVLMWRFWLNFDYQKQDFILTMTSPDFESNDPPPPLNNPS
jgi:hypothetical protein